jgi:hypothetical protein
VSPSKASGELGSEPPRARKAKPFKWRKFFRVTHRDVGYATVALTIAYSVSGLAVNHIDDWNPNYSFEESEFVLEDLPIEGNYPDIQQDALREQLVERLAVDPKTVRGHFLEGPHNFQVFIEEGGEIVLDPATRSGKIKRVHTRAGLYEVNVLHLNNLKGIWTYIADVFALALIFLALTGAFMNKGKTGIAGRGKYFVAGGFVVPLAAIIYMYS